MKIDQECLEAAEKAIWWVDHATVEATAVIAAYLTALEERGMAVVLNGNGASRENPDGVGQLGLDALIAGARLLTPARVAALQADGMPSGVFDRDETGTLAGDIYRAMISAQGE